MYEVELKVPADLDRVRDRLLELDATHLDARVQTDTYYDAPHRDFAATDEALRIRTETPLEGDDPERTVVTYKGPLVEAASKTREEHETGVTDRAEMAAILDGLGFEPAAEVRKQRTFYRLDGLTVTLDRVDDVGEFVEVETEVETEREVRAAREDAAALLDRLGLDADDQVRTSYLGLLLED